MAIWSVLLIGPIILPMALLLRADVSPLIAEGLLLIGVVGLFLAICATEAVGSDPSGGAEGRP